MQSEEKPPGPIAAGTTLTRCATNGTEEDVGSDAEMKAEEEEEAEFNWEEFLEEAGATAAPHTNFKHVELSLQSSFQPGMKLEVANKSTAGTYWVATVITTCGQLLLLRYSGYGDDRKADFWCDVMTAELHPVGWCSLNAKTLLPPQAIQEKYNDWAEFLIQDLTGSRTAPANLLEGPLRGKNTVDLIVVGSVLELQDWSDPSLYWPVRVLRNVGGRLQLCYAGVCEERHVWLFYLDVRLRPLGWALDNDFSLEPPAELRSLKSATQWQQDLASARADGEKNPLPLEVFKDQADVPKHSFSSGMKLEMVSPWQQLHICPVSVSKVFSEFYFQVTLDDLCPDATPRSVLCHAASPAILPVQWCLKNAVALQRPHGYQNHDFDWADYLKESASQAAPDACFPDRWRSRVFSEGMWLEAVNPQRPSQVCVAQISGVRGRLMWLRLEGVSKSISEIIVDVESTDIFPVGWCEANLYPLTSPLRPVYQKQKKIAVVQPEKHLLPSQPAESMPVNHCHPVAMDTGSSNGRFCCSRIFVNHRCFSGPYLNKGRIAELPQSVGPGKCTLVLKELLSMLTNAAYKPGRVLKELQDLEEPSWDCQEETLKAKYKGKTYRSTIRIVRLADQISDFCRKVCLKLQCCPNLLGPVLMAAQCPENCSLLTKTKYTYYYGRKRRLAKPAGGEEPTDGGVSKGGRRRKKRKTIFVRKKRRSSNVDYVLAEPTQDSDEDEEDEEDEDTPLQSASEGSSSEQRDERDGSSRRPRRAAALRRTGRATGSQDASRGRRRSTRSLSAYSQNRYQPDQRDEPQVGQDEATLVLDRNPLEWSVDDVVQFINSTDCASLANVFQEQDVDGQALLLLTLPTVQECLELKLGPAIKLCHHVERLKVAFYRQYAQ